MRKLVLLIAGLVALVLASLFLVRGGTARAVESTRGLERAPDPDAPALPALDVAHPEPAEISALAPATEARDERRAASSGDECRLFGALVDDRDQALPRVGVRAVDELGFVLGAAKSDAQGRFELTLPLPRRTCVLSFAGDRQHASDELVLERSGDGALVAGERDLGRVVLARLGVVSGSVTLANGRAAVGLTVCANTEPPTCTTTRADGTFELAGVTANATSVDVPGERLLSSSAALRGYLFLPGVLEARADIVIDGQALIAGHVVDERGQSCPKASVRGHAFDGRYAFTPSAVCDASGRFTMVLVNAIPHTLRASPQGGRAVPNAMVDPVFQPGEANARLVLVEDVQAAESRRLNQEHVARLLAEQQKFLLEKQKARAPRR